MSDKPNITMRKNGLSPKAVSPPNNPKPRSPNSTSTSSSPRKHPRAAKSILSPLSESIQDTLMTASVAIDAADWPGYFSSFKPGVILGVACNGLMVACRMAVNARKESVGKGGGLQLSEGIRKNLPKAFDLNKVGQKCCRRFGSLAELSANESLYLLLDRLPSL